MQLLEYVSKITGLNTFESRGIILAGKVFINKERCTSCKIEIKESDIIEITYSPKKYVTRSGLKLEAALHYFNINVDNKKCIDLGASEGGFTDCLLQNGAQKVYSVDVAYGIFNWKLRTNDKVILLERTNARYLTKKEIPEKCDIITIDVAFISIEKILPNSKNFLADNGKFIILYKPQFELPKEQLKKNGNVCDPEHIVTKLCDTITFLSNNGIYIYACEASPIHGNNGNIEFLLLGSTDSTDSSFLSKDKIFNTVINAFK